MVHFSISFLIGVKMISEVWALICLAGFYGWILTTIGFIFKSFPVKGVFHGKSAVVWGGSVVFFYIIWLAGMLNT